MAYLGVQPTAGQYRKLDDISPSFNGTTATFTTSVSGSNVTAGSAQQLLVSLGGVIQAPDTDYSVNTNSITFTTAPASGLSFFAILMGDALNTATPSDGSITTAKLGSNLTVDLASGTAGSPSLTFDANTGLFSPGEDQVAVSTGGSERLRITSGGLVGIGTTSPVRKLHIAVAGGDPQLRLQDTSASESINCAIEFNGDTSRQAYIGKAGSTDLLIINDNASGALRFSTNATERARIDSSGRLLVGTSSSRSAGNERLILGETTDNTAGITIVRNSNDGGGSSIGLAKSRGTTVGSNTVVQSGDLLGALFFIGADGTSINNAAAAVRGEVDGTPGTNDMPGRLVFSTTADGASSPTERMRITESGELYINRTSRDSAVGSGCKLQVACSGSEWSTMIRNTNASPFGMRVEHDTDSNGTSNHFFVCVAGGSTTRAQIRSNGGLANFSANNVNLSDRNVKKDIAPAAGTWDCLKEWEIVNFRYKDQPDDDDLNMGVIAQQVAESCPEVIQVFQEAKEATDDQPAQEERIGVKEQQMMWMAIKALQEAQVRIETLEAEIAALKGA